MDAAMDECHGIKFEVSGLTQGYLVYVLRFSVVGGDSAQITTPQSLNPIEKYPKKDEASPGPNWMQRLHCYALKVDIHLPLSPQAFIAGWSGGSCQFGMAVVVHTDRVFMVGRFT